MTPKQKEQLKKEILSKIVDLKQNIESLEKVTKPIGPDRAIGRVARMDAIHMKSIQEANLSNCKKNLFYLEKTLEVIDSPGFGICSLCKKPIGFERIRAMPESNKCIECAEKYGR